MIIDSFIASGEAKWGQMTRLTLLLPHGYEGAGPEHSSARIERFIQLAAEGNMRLANPTTAAQYFHLLRRQARIAKARPLVVFTPEGPAAPAASDLDARRPDLGLLPVRARRPDDRAGGEGRRASCSAAARSTTTSTRPRSARATERVAIARVELLYPFAKEQLTELIAGYPNLKEIVWVQEEPRNMGAWTVMQRRMPELVPEGVEFGYVGRPPRASPGEGYPVAHTTEQERIVLTAWLRARPTRPGAAPGGEPAGASPMASCLRKPVPGPLFAWVRRVVLGWSWRCSPALLFFWLAPGFEHQTFIFGLTHGIGYVSSG